VNILTFQNPKVRIRALLLAAKSAEHLCSERLHSCLRLLCNENARASGIVELNSSRARCTRRALAVSDSPKEDLAASASAQLVLVTAPLTGSQGSIPTSPPNPNCVWIRSYKFTDPKCQQKCQQLLTQEQLDKSPKVLRHDLLKRNWLCVWCSSYTRHATSFGRLEPESSSYEKPTSTLPPNIGRSVLYSRFRNRQTGKPRHP
jgi:hypothetical protein